MIAGTITASAGTYFVQVNASDGIFTSTRTLTWTILSSAPAPPSGAGVFDSFTSNGSVESLATHVPDVAPAGASWTMLSGAMANVSGGVLAPSSSNSYTIAAIQTGTANGTIGVDFRSTSSHPVVGLALRIGDAWNQLLLRYVGHWGSGRLELVRRVNAEFKVIRSVSVGPLDDGTHRMEARMSGLSITGIWDGVSLFETTVNDNQFSTVHGLFWDPTTDLTATYDNFTVTTTVAAPTIQPGRTCEATLSQWAINAESGHTTVNVDVTMPDDCRWSQRLLVGPGAPIATIPDPNPRFGNGTAQVELDNTTDDYPRMAFAIIAGQLVTIVQAGLVYSTCGYYVSPVELDFGAGADVATLSVTPFYWQCAWTVTSDRDWIEVSDVGLRNGTGTFTVRIAANTGAATRNGHIRVGTGEIAVEQNGDLCALSLSPSSFNVSFANQTLNATVTAPNGCGWEAISQSSFITVSQPSNPSGTAPIQVTVLDNPQLERRAGTVEIRRNGYAVAVLDISQGGQGECTYSVNPASVAVGSGSGVGAFSITTAPGCAWSAVSDAAFVHVTSAPSGTGSGSVAFSFDANQTTGPRIGAIRIENAVVTVNQPAPGGQPSQCVFSTSFVANGEADQGVLNVTTDAGCAWRVSASAPWISFDHDEGIGSGTVVVSMDRWEANGAVGSISIAEVVGPNQLPPDFPQFCPPPPCTPDGSFCFPPVCLVFPPWGRLPQPAPTGPSVTILDANLETNQIRVRLTGNVGSSQLTIRVRSRSTFTPNSLVLQANYSPGEYTLNFTTSSVQQWTPATYEEITASWSSRSASRNLRFTVLGTYHHTQYNVPTETACSGTPPGVPNASREPGVHPVQVPCQYSTAISLKPQFITQTWTNGHGVSNSNGILTLPYGCSQAQFATGNTFREVTAVTGSALVPLNATTIAVHDGNTDLRGSRPGPTFDRILIVGYGGGLGTAKTVRDRCGSGCADDPKHHVDNFSLVPFCSGRQVGDLGTGYYQTIRLGR